MLAWISAVAFADPLVAVVVIDQAAREEGYALELEDLVVEDALPIDVAEGEHVRIVDPDGRRHPLDVAPGEAWEVSGPRGEAWMSRLGEEVRTDVLVVRGDADAIVSLARALDADVRREDGRVYLVADGILFAAPWAQADGLDRVDEVGFVRRDAAVDPGAARRAPRRIPAAPVAIGVVAPPAVASRPSHRFGSDGGSPMMGLERALLAADAAPTRPVAPVAPTGRPAALDARPYLGSWLCADGSVLFLSSGGFAAAGVRGTWFVSSPGVVRLFVHGMPWGRAAFLGDRPYCRVVWEDGTGAPDAHAQ